ncbi:hypothetical protein EIMP300_75570 [Escherichia coli]|uniref:D-alanine--D-alanine ligase A n=1 Tax=Escherichia coli TaxID=562 RepID=A0A8S0G1Y4_ECOLX|nr:hypothetical protein EIMP300_75570 [Escherichia coli]
MIVEQGIKGREIECAVLGNNNPQASTCGEIVLTSDFYAYDTKYIDEDGAKVVVPAAIAPEINDKIRAIAVQAYQTLGCAGMARVDVFLTPENEVVINEINTLPGFTNISMYPKLWQASGLGYTDLITRLIELALERHAADNALKTTMQRLSDLVRQLLQNIQFEQNIQTPGNILIGRFQFLHRDDE